MENRDLRFKLVYAEMTETEMIIARWIRNKFDGGNQDAAAHGVYLDAWPEHYKSELVQCFEEEYGPLRGQITNTEMKILDLIHGRAEEKTPLSRVPSLTPEEIEEFKKYEKMREGR